MTSKYNQWQFIDEFLLNVILVLNHARPAYRIFMPKDLSNDLIATVLSYYPELSVIRYDEPLLFLTINKDFVEENYTTTIGISKVLGYCYNEFDWMNTSIDRLAITPTATDDNHSVELYHTMIPKYAYQGKILNCVLDQIKLFDRILQPYGFKVTLSIEVIAGKQDAYSYHYNQMLNNI